MLNLATRTYIEVISERQSTQKILSLQKFLLLLQRIRDNPGINDLLSNLFLFYFGEAELTTYVCVS